MYLCYEGVEKNIDHGKNCYETHIFQPLVLQFLGLFFWLI